MPPTDYLSFFHNQDITKGYSSDELLRLVKLLKIRRFASGESILEEGHVNDAFHFLYHGEVEVWKRDPGSGDTYLINTMKTGALFGEMSEITGEPTSASIRAKSDCEVLMLKRSDQLPTDIQMRLMLGCSRNIIQRLRLLTERQAHLMAEEAQRERELLQSQLRQNEEELIAKKGELLDAKRQLSSLYMELCDDGTNQSYSGMIGSSQTMREIYQMIRNLSHTDTTVLISGKSGTGKGMIAAAIHCQSKRAKEVIVSLNCAALGDELLLSELFGHRKGAFTGAHEDRVGRFQLANGGTIFLDEIGDISPRMQASLLRVLESGEYERVGESKTLKSDVRVIAATNKDLRAKVEEGRFREDLYYRLNVVNVTVPPLKERKEDIPLLTGHFVSQFNRQFGRTVKGFSEAAQLVLMNYNWPGNVRELRNVVERAMILSSEEILQVEHLPQELTGELKGGATVHPFITSMGVAFPSSSLRNRHAGDLTRDILLKELRESVWNVSKAAFKLNISRTHLHRLIKQHQIKRGD